MIQYEHIVEGKRRSFTYDSQEGAAHIGQRYLSGFEAWQAYVEDPQGRMFALVVFQSDVTGQVWCVYFDA